MPADRKNFIIYKSSAGSGKTTALIRFFLILSLRDNQPAAFKKILAITFTNKAANEMKERFIETLIKIKSLEISEGNRNYKPENFLIAELLDELKITPAELKNRAEKVFHLALRDYGEISIGTIDGFNHRLIRSFSRELSLKTDFEVEMDEPNLFRDAVEELLDRVGEDELLTKHLISFVRAGLEDDRKVNLTKKLEELRKLIMSEDSVAALTALEKLHKEDFPQIRKQLKSNIKSFEEKLRKIGSQALELLETAGIESDSLHFKEYFPTYFRKLISLDADKLGPNTRILNRRDQSWANSKISAEQRIKLESVQAELNVLFSDSIELIEKEESRYITFKEILKNIDLLAVLIDLSDVLRELINERNVLPISFFNRLISKAIQNEPVAFIYENFGTRYRHILIDEFQDTSTLQWKNLIPLIHESLSSGNSSLIVGDAKQSIYRWRGGEAEQLIVLPELPDIFRSDPGQVASFRAASEIIPLSTNYRSRTQIIEFNNKFIEELSRRMLPANSLYRKEYIESLHQDYPKGREGGYVQVHFYGKDPKIHETVEKTLSQIEEAIKDGFEYGDIALLFRSAKKELVRALIREFSKRDIPFITKDSFGLDQNIIVECLISFFRLSLDFTLNPPKVKILRILSTIYNRPHKPSEFLLAHGKSNDIDLIGFLSTLGLKIEKNKLSRLSAFDLSRYIISSLLPIPHQKDLFLETFLDTILKKGGKNLSVKDFLDWWDSISEKPSASGGEKENQIEILTIHKAKGLQFNVCIAPELNWPFKTSYSDQKWMPIENLSPLTYAPLPDSSKKMNQMGFVDYSNQEEEASKFDNLNLIYVCLTRAIERLYLNFSVNNKDADSKKNEDMKNTGAVLYQSAISLKENWPEHEFDTVSQDENSLEPFTLHVGEREIWNKKIEATSKEKFLVTKEKVDIDIDRRLQISDEETDEVRDIGVLFHTIMGNSINLESAISLMKRFLANGRLKLVQYEELKSMVHAIYSDERFKNLIEASQILPERELSADGKILRPDLVLQGKNSFTVIDFKTGAHQLENHKNQVAEYLRAIKQVWNQDGKGYVLYVPAMQWLEVENRSSYQGSLF